MLTKEQIEKIFIDSEALMKGHFRLTSGRHSDQYMQCAKVLMIPKYTAALCGHIKDHYEGEKIDLVIGPATGGIILSYEMASQLDVPSIFTERVDGQMVLRRNFEINPGDRVLVMEDVVTTGGSVVEVIDLVKEKGGIVVGVGLLVDRSNGTVDLGVKTVACLTMNVVSYEAEDCPLCKDNVLIIKPGSRVIK